MADNSAIEWTDATWNPVTGCTKISAGCDNCYAERFSERFRGVKGHPFKNGFDLTLRPERIGQPLEWKKSRMIFVNSMSDLFHKEIPKDHISKVFETMAAFKFDKIGYWSELKLEIVEKYGAAYTNAFNNSKNLKKYYIDAFSGAGVHLSKSLFMIF